MEICWRGLKSLKLCIVLQWAQTSGCSEACVRGGDVWERGCSSDPDLPQRMRPWPSTIPPSVISVNDLLHHVTKLAAVPKKPVLVVNVYWSTCTFIAFQYLFLGCVFDHILYYVCNDAGLIWKLRVGFLCQPLHIKQNLVENFIRKNY